MQLLTIPAIHPAALPRPFSKGLHGYGITHLELFAVVVIFGREAAILLKAQG
jgi:hypothetical protein